MAKPPSRFSSELEDLVFAPQREGLHGTFPQPPRPKPGRVVTATPRSRMPFSSDLDGFLLSPKLDSVHEAPFRLGRSVKELLMTPLQLRLEGVRLAGSLPPDFVLREMTVEELLGLPLADVVVKTQPTFRTSVALLVSREFASVRFTPGILFDVKFAQLLDVAELKDIKVTLGVAELNEIKVTLGSDEIDVDVRDVSDPSLLQPLELLDVTEDVRSAVQALLGPALRSSPFSEPGYDPTRDPRLIDSCVTFYQALETGPGLGRNPLVDITAIDSLSARFVLLRDFRQGDEDAELFQSGGSSLDVKLDLRTTLGALTDAVERRSGQSFLEAVNLRSVRLNATILVAVKGQPVAFLDALRMDRKGQVFVENMTLLDTAKAVQEAEKAGRFAFNLFVEGLRALKTAREEPGLARSLGLPLAAHAIAKAAQRTLERPTVIEAHIRSKIEKRLTDAVRQIIRENARAIPGVDLSELFDVAPAP